MQLRHEMVRVLLPHGVVQVHPGAEPLLLDQFVQVLFLGKGGVVLLKVVPGQHREGPPDHLVPEERVRVGEGHDDRKVVRRLQDAFLAVVSGAGLVRPRA